MITVTRVKPVQAPDYLIRLSPEKAVWLADMMDKLYVHNKGVIRDNAKELRKALDAAKTIAELHGGYTHDVL